MRPLVQSGWQDSNLRPPAPKAGAITGLRYTPNLRLQMKELIYYLQNKNTINLISFIEEMYI